MVFQALKQHYDIDDVIIDRGRKYFRQGRVCDLEEVDEGCWSALVDGSEPYEVTIEIDDRGRIRKSACTCPYDLGPVCKHVVATAMAVDASSGDNVIEVHKSMRTKSKRSSRRPTDMEEVRLFLEKASPGELNSMVENYAKEDRSFRNHLMRIAISKSEKPKERKDYQRLIRTDLRAAVNRDGFIGYWEAGRAVEGTWELIEKANEWLQERRPSNALPVFQAAIDEMVPALQYADDSNGEIGSVIEAGFEGLWQCVQTMTDPGDRDALLAYCLKEAGRAKYEGWDWKMDFFRLAGELVGTERQRGKLFGALDATLECSGRGFGRYDEERACEIKICVLERLGDKCGAEAMLANNLDLPAVREQAIRRSFEEKRLDDAKRLAIEGRGQAEKNGLPGLVSQWDEWLLKIANVTKDEEEVMSVARRLFLQTGKFEHYHTFKSHFASDVWPREVERILKDMKGPGARTSFGIFEEVLIKEKMWDRLLGAVRNSPSFHTLECYHKYLAAHYPSELADLYAQIAQETLARGTGRPLYQDVCRMLRRMKKLGADKKADDLMAEFRERYRNRPALLEELRGV